MQVITAPGLSDEAAAARSADGIPVGHDLAIVIDLGGQYAPLIARRIREHGTFSHLVGAHVTAAEIAAYEPSAIVLSGGPSSVNEPDAPTIDPAVFELGIPMLGVCYGMQLMARELGGAVGHSGESEYGRATITRTADASTLLGIFSEASVWMSHRDCVTRLPEGFVATTTSDLGIASIENTERQLYAVQFHPEVTHTDTDGAILEAFLHEIAGARADWTAAAFIDEQIESIRAAVGDGHAIVGLSGGVDSAVAAALAHRALGERLTCVFVDHGLNRAGEREQVQEIFGNAFHMQLITIDAATEFIAELAGVEDPEAKRLRIGERFIRVFERAARDIDNADHLVQGTLYSDVIESGGGSGTANIKSHHNVGGLPEDLGFSLVEPLRELFKDEVRQVGRELGLPDEVINRHPFPGPGLAIRIIGEVTRERLDIVRAADAIVREEVHAAGLGGEVWQAFAVLPALKSVGVQGDGRTYGYPIVIRAVQSDDAMTADWVRLPHEVIETMSSRITNEVPQINRVVYDVTSKPPATIEWE